METVWGLTFIFSWTAVVTLTLGMVEARRIKDYGVFVLFSVLSSIAIILLLVSLLHIFVPYIQKGL